MHKTIKSSVGQISIEIKSAEHIVVFSHGFGVKRDSRGLFSDIVGSLPSNMGYVLFDYNQIEIVDGVEHVHLRSYDQQRIILDELLALARQNADRVSLIGHSMGCVTTALLAPENLSSVTLLAPPVSQSSGRKYFSEYPGAFRDETGTLIVPRRDGTITHVSDDFWDQAEAYFPPELFMKYADQQTLTVIKARDEDVLKNTQNYDLLRTHKNISLVELPGNHNFDAPFREQLVNYCVDELTSSR